MKAFLWIMLVVNTMGLAINAYLGKINLEILSGVAVLAVLMALHKEDEE
jgi:hypothetical protein